MSTIVIFSGTGYAGGNIAREAVARGHRVISYSRTAPTETAEGVEYRTGSLTDDAVLAQAASEADDLVVATHGADVGGSPLVDHVARLTSAAIEHGARLSFVGGAGTLDVAKGVPASSTPPSSTTSGSPRPSPTPRCWTPCAPARRTSTGSTSPPPHSSARGHRARPPAPTASATTS
uniref:NAD(P)H-binding protein n=1 Tax=Janibacter limosus TaxID=53458 RepID=A0AC61U8B7_9MICO|nr:NAD(P)H-binding protein [Janibacter limosus]